MTQDHTRGRWALIWLAVVAWGLAALACGTAEDSGRDIVPGSEREAAEPKDDDDDDDDNGECRCTAENHCRCPDNPPPPQPGPPPWPDFSKMTDLRVVRNITDQQHNGECWHYRNGVPRWNVGDGQVGIAETDRGKEYWYVSRRGTPPPGGVFFRKPYDGNPYEGWDISLDGAKSIPSYSDSPSFRNIDTHVWAINRLSKLATFLHGSKTGWLFPTPPGYDTKGMNTFAIQRAQSAAPLTNPDSFRRFPQVLLIQPDPFSPYEETWHAGTEWFGGSGESSIVAGETHMEIYWSHKTYADKPDAFGQRFKVRIHRATCPLTIFDQNPNMNRTPAMGYVYDPVEVENYGDTNDTAVWGTANTVMQSHVFKTADGMRYMLHLGKKPHTRAGIENSSLGIGIARSFDKGLTWERYPENPIIVPADMAGFEDLPIANRINSPFGFEDKQKGVLYIGHWGNPVGQQNKEGTRLWMCEVPYPPKP